MISHQQIEELVEAVEDQMGVAYIRLDWMPESEEPFEAKQFVIDGLKGTHNILCMQHVHAPTVNEDGNATAKCPYCGYGGSVNDADGLFSPG